MIEISQRSHSPQEILCDEALGFYRRAMTLLLAEKVPFLVGGAYAFSCYTGIVRDTKDFDLFVHPRSFGRTLAVFSRAGYATDTTFPHWLGKVFQGESFVDVIFSSGNGVARVDDGWFEHSVEDEVLGVRVRLVPPEEMIWSKSTIMERERFDGADVAHLLRSRADDLDWRRLLDRFGDEHARVLLAHLVLFGYIYEDAADRVPPAVLDRLLDRVRAGPSARRPGRPICRGTILSRAQYLPDVEKWGYRDPRLIPMGAISEQDLALWTAAALEQERQHR